MRERRKERRRGRMRKRGWSDGKEDKLVVHGGEDRGRGERETEGWMDRVVGQGT